MKRRDFLGLMGGVAAAAWTRPLFAQQARRNYRLGVATPSGRDNPPIAAFFDELRRAGFIEGQNLTVIAGGFNTSFDRNAEVAAAVVKAAPDAIISDANPARIIKQLTRTIPTIIMGEDILADGLVDSLARPGANVTGISIMSPDLDGKRQDLLLDAVPRARHIAALVDANTMRPTRLQQYKDAARSRGVELSLIEAKTPQDIAAAIERAKTIGAEALNVLATPLFGSYQNRGIVFRQVAAMRMPAIYQWPEMAEDGGFMAYGPSFIDLYRQRARMVVKVLRGTQPADIPVEQPTRFDLVVNLKAAKAIGRDIPAGLVLRADRLIE
jgi:putative ABC transport system substrate-binding protein